MKTRHLLMLAGVAGAAWLAFFGDKSADTDAAGPVARRPALPPSSIAAPAGERVSGSSTLIEAESHAAQGKGEVHILALQPRAELMSMAGSEHGLFAGRSAAPSLAALKQVTAPAPAPTAPPLPFTYLGKQLSGGHMEVYLARGDEVFVVRDNSVIQNTYRVEAIRPPTLSFVYLPLNEIQRLSIGVTN